MSMTEILDELPRLNEGERRAILHRLAELDAGLDLDETPEMLAAIDAGIRSMESGSGVPLDERRAMIASSEDLFQRLDEEEGEAAGKQWLGE